MLCNIIVCINITAIIIIIIIIIIISVGAGDVERKLAVTDTYTALVK
jgi:hypothetical protein